jgi:GT2 family glycosyltransferase
MAESGNAGLPFHKLLAVLVVYQQDFRQCTTYQSLQKSTLPLNWFVVDNSPEPQVHQENVQYRHYPHNPGVSQAYLDGAAYANSVGIGWMLLLDQDSCFPEDFGKKLTEGIQQWPGYALYSPQMWSGEFGISPAPYRFGRGFASRQLPQGPYSLFDYCPINAGMCVEVAAYRASGGHIPAVYLDFSDFAFIHRFRTGYATAVALPLAMQHELSGTQRASKTQNLRRFGHYCRGARAFANHGGPQAWLLFWMLVRSVQLCIRHRTFAFFSVILRPNSKN